MTTAMYDTLDSKVRYAGKVYDDAREGFFAGHNNSYRNESAAGLAIAERHAEASAWAARWSRLDDGTFEVELLDGEKHLLASRHVNSTADQPDFARVLEAHLAAVALRGDPRELFMGWEW